MTLRKVLERRRRGLAPGLVASYAHNYFFAFHREDGTTILLMLAA